MIGPPAVRGGGQRDRTGPVTSPSALPRRLTCRGGASVVPFRPRPGRVARPVRRRRLPRRAVPWWAATVALAVATGLVADELLQRATDAEARWGATRTVLVATAPLEPGDALAGRTMAAGCRRAPCRRRRWRRRALRGGRRDRRRRGGHRGPDRRARRHRPGRPAAARHPRRADPARGGGPAGAVGDHVDLLASRPPRRSPGRRRSSGSARALVVALPPPMPSRVAGALGRGPLVPALVSARTADPHTRVLACLPAHGGEPHAENEGGVASPLVPTTGTR